VLATLAGGALAVAIGAVVLGEGLNRRQKEEPFSHGESVISPPLRVPMVPRSICNTNTGRGSTKLTHPVIRLDRARLFQGGSLYPGVLVHAG